MELFEILFMTSVVLLTSSIFLYFVIKKPDFLRKCTIIFYFNTFEKSFRLSKTSPTWVFHYFFIKKTISNLSKSYNSIEKVNGLFKSKTISKKIRSAFLHLDTYKKNDFTFTATITKKKNKYNLLFKFVMTDKNKGIGSLNIYKKKKESVKVIVNNNYNNLSKYITPSTFTRMYAIKIDNQFNDLVCLISREIAKNVRCSTFFWQQEGVLYLVSYSKKQKALKKAHKIILKHLSEWNKINPVRSVCWASFLDVYKGDLNKNIINNNKSKLDFYIYKLIKSSRYSKNFVLSVDDDVDQDEEFVQFKSVSSTLSHAIRSDSVNGLVRKIYNTNTKKVSGKYVVPRVSDIVPNKYKEIIDIKQTRNKLVDCLAFNAATVSKNIFPRGSIIELNGAWLQKNHSKIVNPNYLYCICVNDKKSINKIRKILSSLSETKNIKYGLKITKDLQADNTIFDGLDLSFIVVSEEISSRANHRLEFSVILLINIVLKHTKIKIIYINPTPKLDSVQRKKLNIRYVVKT